MLKRVQHDNRVWVSFFVIPNQVLNLALKQVQGLSNSIYDFGISVLGFKVPPCGRGSLLRNTKKFFLKGVGIIILKCFRCQKDQNSSDGSIPNAVKAVRQTDQASKVLESRFV
jgi:hypothetical protein